MNFKYRVFRYSDGEYGIKYSKWWWPYWNKLNDPKRPDTHWWSGSADSAKAHIDKLLAEQKLLNGVHK